ncbi:MAG: hypothetical protein AB1349_08840, partial [Elusimicrobiota bacterium]
FQNSKSNFKGQTFDLNEFANIFYSGSDEPYQKNSVYSRFSGRSDKDKEKIYKVLNNIFENRIRKID